MSDRSTLTGMLSLMPSRGSIWIVPTVAPTEMLVLVFLPHRFQSTASSVQTLSHYAKLCLLRASFLPRPLCPSLLSTACMNRSIPSSQTPAMCPKLQVVLCIPTHFHLECKVRMLCSEGLKPRDAAQWDICGWVILSFPSVQSPFLFLGIFAKS